MRQRFIHLLFNRLTSRVPALLALVLCGATSVVAQTAANTATAQLLIEQAENDGEAPVIIQLDLSSRPEGELATLIAKVNQRQSIKNAQDRLLANLSAYQVKQLKKFKYLPYVAMKLDAAGLNAALEDPDVLQVYQDRLSAPSLAVSTPLIGATDAWAAGYSGSGQVVAVLDTGVDSSHAFLAGKVVHEACYSTTNATYNASTVCPNGLNEQVGSGAGVPCAVDCAHGTHVAGIAAGKGSGGTTFSGVAKDANIMALQVFSRFDSSSICNGSSPCVLSFTSDQIAALEHIYAQRHNFSIAAANMSLGGGNYPGACDADNTAIKAAIDLLRSVEIATIVASGNDGLSSGISAPACISSAISVGSTTKSDVVSSFSNSAQILDLLAPGSGINSSVPGGSFSSFSGTSMATPHVAGAFAMLRSKESSASVDEILTVLKSTGVEITDLRNGIIKSRIQVDTALDNIGAAPVDGILAVTPTANFTASGVEGGPFSPASMSYTLTNTGAASIDFTVSESMSWASVSPTSGTLAPGGDSTVTVSIGGDASTLPAGDRVSAITFSNTTNGRGNTSRTQTLTITGPAAANDKFIDGILLPYSTGSTEGSSQNGSKESGEPNHAGNSGGRSVWWSWVASAAGSMTIDLAGSNFDTLLGVYTGTGVDALTAIAGNDDANGGLQSRATFETQAGVTYHIAVDGYGGASGSIDLSWGFIQDTTPGEEIVVTPETGFTATGAYGGPFGPSSIIYTLTNVSTIPQPFVVGNVPNWLTPSATSGTLAPSASTTIGLTISPFAYALQGGNYTSTVLFNTVSRTMSLDVISTGSGNNNFSSATQISGVLPLARTGSNVGADKEAGEPFHGGNAGGTSVWWHWTPSATVTVDLDTFGSLFDTTLGVYTGTGVSSLTTVGSNDDSGGGLQSQLSFTAIGGTTYYIAVDGYNGGSGAISLNLAAAAGGPPANDTFASAITLSGTPPLNTSGSSFGASKEPGEPSHAGNSGGSSVWWKWQAASSQTVTIDTFGSGFDTILGVYTGTQVDALTTSASNDDDGVLQSRVSFQALAGTDYYIAVDGYSGASGSISLNISVAAAVNYSLQVKTAGNGSVTSAPAGINCQIDCAEDYAKGTNVILTATPASGSYFQGWSGHCSGSGSCALSMSASRGVTATFAEIPVLTVTAVGSGTVTSTPAGIECGVDCSEAFSAGTSVSLTVTPVAGWLFSGWSGACTGEGSCEVSMATSQSVVAIFTVDPASYRLSVSTTGSGIVTSSLPGILCHEDCSEFYSSGTSVTLTALPISDWSFSHWSGACDGSGSCSIVMTSAKSVVAVFTEGEDGSYPGLSIILIKAAMDAREEP